MPDYKKEQLAEQIHIWYLESTKELRPESYNPNAQKSYAELTEEQKFMDRYLADKILSSNKRIAQQVVESLVDKIKHKYNGYGGVLGFTQSDLLSFLNTLQD